MVTQRRSKATPHHHGPSSRAPLPDPSRPPLPQNLLKAAIEGMKCRRCTLRTPKHTQSQHHHFARSNNHPGSPAARSAGGVGTRNRRCRSFTFFPTQTPLSNSSPPSQISPSCRNSSQDHEGHHGDAGMASASNRCPPNLRGEAAAAVFKDDAPAGPSTSSPNVEAGEFEHATLEVVVAGQSMTKALDLRRQTMEGTR